MTTRTITTASAFTITTLLALSLLSGCAGSGQEGAGYAAPSAFDRMDCAQLAAENNRLADRLAAVRSRLSQTANLRSSDNSITGNANQATQVQLDADYARLTLTLSALQQSQRNKQCSVNQ